MRLNQMHLTRTSSVDLWHQRLEQTSSKILQTSAQYVKGVGNTNFENVGHREA